MTASVIPRVSLPPPLSLPSQFARRFVRFPRSPPDARFYTVDARSIILSHNVTRVRDTNPTARKNKTRHRALGGREYERLIYEKHSDQAPKIEGARPRSVFSFPAHTRDSVSLRFGARLCFPSDPSAFFLLVSQRQRMYLGYPAIGGKHIRRRDLFFPYPRAPRLLAGSIFEERTARPGK